MNRYWICLAAWVLTASACANAQDATVVRVDYVTVLVHADGTETSHSEGVHYIAADGRYRHDETVAGGTSTSSYRLPDVGVNVSVNHSLLEAVRSGLVSPLDVAVPADRGSATPFNVPPPTEIGERTLGPLRLRGFAHDQEGVGRIEHWEYVHPTTRTATDPFVYPPIGIELTVSMSTGERLETRATSVRRVPLEADTFVVPDPAP